MKLCTKCEIEKEEKYFSKSKRTKSGLQGWCKQCMNEARSSWNERNPERRSAGNKSWAERNPDKVRKNSLEWRNRNLERAREISRNWKKNNPETHARIQQKRRAIQAGAIQGYFPTLSELVELYGPSCMYPGCVDETLTIDHVVPLSLGGLHDISNAQILCSFHNSQKGNRNSEDYRPKE